MNEPVSKEEKAALVSNETPIAIFCIHNLCETTDCPRNLYNHKPVERPVKYENDQVADVQVRDWNENCYVKPEKTE